MVRNVGNDFNIRNVYQLRFKANTAATVPMQNSSTAHNNNINNLQDIKPEYNIRAPQPYKKLGEIKLDNGLIIHSYMLNNGHKVTIVPMEGSPAVVKNYVNVGSMNETDDIKGISHFLEHMAFNGTTGENNYKKLVWGDSFKLIEKMGGWTNASTNYAITDYVNSTPQLEDNDIHEQLKIIAAMTEDLALTEDMIEKEKNPVCSEINMIMDDPQTIAIDQTIRTLFNVKSSADELVGGSAKHIQNLTREKVKEYYDKYYTPDNMNLVITGDVKPEEIIETVSKEFHSTKKTQGQKYEERIIPIQSCVRKDFISDKATDTNIIIGFSGPASNDTKSLIAKEILSAYINTENVGINKDLRDLNAYVWHTTDKISSNPYNPQISMFMINSSEEKAEKALKAVYERLGALKAPDEETLGQIKEKLLMDNKDCMEYSSSVNNLIGHSVLSGNTDYITEYENILKNVTTEDIEKCIKKYFDVNRAAITVVHPNTTSEKINENYNLSFRGKERKPVETEKITEKILDNNYKVAFCDTKNDNISFNVVMKYDIPKDINPAVFAVLSYIYDTGIKYQTESDYKKFNEKNNIDNYVSVEKDHLTICGYSGYENFELNINKALELYKNPRINDEEVSKAVGKIKENIIRTPDTADRLYTDYESQFNPQYVSKAKMLESLDKLTKDDIVKLCKYISENSEGYVIMNTPEGDEKIKNTALRIFDSLKTVKPYTIKTDNVYHETNESVILTKDRPVSQADISQIYKFKTSDDIKEQAVIEIMNTILSSSNSIGLFNSLRERDHLAYSVFSDYYKSEDCGTVSLNILTTTDNKDTGEINYDNVQKSINGFNRQIGLLLNSAYTDEDLESAKRSLKADLLNQEGVRNKLYTLSLSMNKQEGIEYENKMYKIIDSITREDIDNMSNKIFSNKPIYSIVASSDTLEANKEYFENLRI